jgi:hypothetical protein
MIARTNRAKYFSRAGYNGNLRHVHGGARMHIIHLEYLQKC